MNNKEKLLYSIYLGLFFFCISQIPVYTANVPLPQSQQNQMWDNFNINTTFNVNSINTNQIQPKAINNDSIPAQKTETIPIIKQETFPNQNSINIQKENSNIKSEQIYSQETIPQQSKTLTQDKADSLIDLRNNAKLLYNANKPDEAQKLYQQIPDSEKISEDWLYIANIAQDNGKDLDAVFYLKKAIQVDNNNYKAHYNLGNLYLIDNKVNMAIDEYNKAIKAKKDFSYAYYNKGCAYLMKKNYYNAKYEFGLAIKNNPEEPTFYYNLAYTYKMMNKEKKANEALEIYEKLMQK